MVLYGDVLLGDSHDSNLSMTFQSWRAESFLFVCCLLLVANCSVYKREEMEEKSGGDR